MRRLWARESVGFLAEFTLSSGGAIVDLTGWTFALVLTRRLGTSEIILGMAVSAAAQGFFILAAAEGRYQLRISAAALQAIVDTTGDFTMIGDIIGTDADGARHFIEDLELQVTEGPTP